MASARAPDSVQLLRAPDSVQLLRAPAANCEASAQPLEQSSIDEVYQDDQPWFMDLGERADSEIEREQLLAQLTIAITGLPEREAMVLQLYFVEELNLEEIGEVLAVGAARVYQIKKAALQKPRVLSMLGLTRSPAAMSTIAQPMPLQSPLSSA